MNKKIIMSLFCVFMLLAVRSAYAAVNGADIAATAIQMSTQGLTYCSSYTGPSCFDCTGLIKYIYAQYGIDLPWSSNNYYSNPTAYGTIVSSSNALPGDLLIWDGHAAIYIGNGEMVDATPGSGVKRRNVTNFAWTAGGSHTPPTYYLRVYNVTYSPNQRPVGYIDGAAGMSNGTLHLYGWAYDPDHMDRNEIWLDVRLNGDGDLVTQVSTKDAVFYRPDVNQTYPYHGFNIYIPVPQRGTYKYGIWATGYETAVARDWTKIGEATVTISADNAYKISLSKEKIDLKTGQSQTLSVTYLPSDTVNKSVTWKTGNSNIATVSNGKVTGKGSGTTVITATAYGTSDVTATCTVTVTGVSESEFKLVLPDELTEIKSSAFEGSTSITEVYIPDGVTSIGDRAFANCTGLAIAHIPNSVTTIGANAFLNDSNVVLYCQSDNNGAAYARQNNIAYIIE